MMKTSGHQGTLQFSEIVNGHFNTQSKRVLKKNQEFAAQIEIMRF